MIPQACLQLAKNLYEQHPSTPGDEKEIPGLDHNYYRCPLNKPFTRPELDIVIYKLKRNKAAGRDKILAEFIKASPDSIITLLLSLLNIIYKTAIVPKDWCLGIITPIHKCKGMGSVGEHMSSSPGQKTVGDKKQRLREET